MGNDDVSRLLPLLYLASPGLPTGAYAWSQGLAGAIEQGVVADGVGLAEWLAGIMDYGLARFDLPLFCRCWRAARDGDYAALRRWNAEVLAGRETAELFDEEVRLGTSLWRILHDQNFLPDWARGERPGYVCAFAAASVFLGDGGGTPGEAASAFTWSWLENQVAVAAKAIPLGQTAAGSVLLRLMPRVAAVVRLAQKVEDDAIGASLPGVVLASMRHERQYSRMFRS